MPSRQDNRAATRARKRVRSPERIELQHSKLSPPSARAGLIDRVDLVGRLTASHATPCVSLVAPPGYGKTTVLGQWATRDPRPFAWLSLDRRDNDPVVLLAYLATALNADGSIGAADFTALSSGRAQVRSGVAKLTAAIASRRRPVVLVLDDAHLLDDPVCLELVSTLAQHVPPGSQVVFAGRVAPEVGLARARVDGRLLELGSEALALDDAEAGELLTAAGVELTPTEVADLNRHAEGWAAGLYLAALSLAQGKASVATFDGSDRFVTEYLRGEELTRTDPGLTEFLLGTAVLETMTGSLCDTVLERSGSAAVLERLERENLFVVPLDHKLVSYRYHHLFREMLLGELERDAPGRAAGLRARAAAWCEANGAVEDAIEYATAGEDREALARLVTANLFPYFRGGRVKTVERWLEALDDERLAEHPDVVVFGTWLHALRGRPEEAERWALALEAVDKSATLADGTPVEAYIALARALLCRHGVEAMHADVERGLAELSVTSPLRPGCLTLAGVAALLLGDEERAALVYREAAEAAAAVGAVWAGVVAHAELALLALDRGDLQSAQAETELASDLVGDVPDTDYAMTAILHAATARLAIAQRKGARARQALAAAQRLRPAMTHSLPWYSTRVRVELATAQLALGDRRGASMLLREVDDILWRRPRLGTVAAAAERLREEIAKTPDESDGWASTLTAAELRLLPLLTTHLSFREIAARLFVSRNTVKTQAISIYRKLGASSRSEAIERAVSLGLVDAPAPAPDFTRSG